MIAVSTIGKEKAQVVLAQILQKLDNPKLTSVIMGRLQDFKKGADEIADNLNEYAETLLRLWRDDALAKMQARTDVNDECMRFWQNCLHIEYKKALEKIHWKRDEGKVSRTGGRGRHWRVRKFS